MKLRILIIQYMRQPDTKMGPINLLIWMDQLNGFFSAVNILGRIVALALPFPMRDLVGDWFCRWTPLPGIQMIFLESIKDDGVLL